MKYYLIKKSINILIKIFKKEKKNHDLQIYNKDLNNIIIKFIKIRDNVKYY